MKIHQHPKNPGPRDWTVTNRVEVIIDRKLAIERVEEYFLHAIERVHGFIWSFGVIHYY